jgi:hypothetical protein
MPAPPPWLPAVFLDQPRKIQLRVQTVLFKVMQCVSIESTLNHRGDSMSRVEIAEVLRQQFPTDESIPDLPDVVDKFLTKSLSTEIKELLPILDIGLTPSGALTKGLNLGDGLVVPPGTKLEFQGDTVLFTLPSGKSFSINVDDNRTMRVATQPESNDLTSKKVLKDTGYGGQNSGILQLYGPNAQFSNFSNALPNIVKAWLTP